MQSKSVCLNYCFWSRIELGLLLLLEFNGVLHKLFIKVKKKEIRLSYPSVCTLVPEEAEDFFFYQNMSKRLSPATPLYAQTVQRAAAKIKKKEGHTIFMQISPVLVCSSTRKDSVKRRRFLSRKCDFFHTAATASGRRRRESCNTLIAIQGKSRKRPLSIDYDTMMHFEIEFLVAIPLHCFLAGVFLFNF